MTLSKIQVTYGEEMFQVTGPDGRWCHFKVGPFSCETEIRIGEQPADAYRRAWDIVNKQADQVYVAKRNRFFAHLEDLTKKQ